MELREIGERVRDLRYDQSLKNPLYLQTNVAVKSVHDFFSSLPENGLTIYDFGCGAKPDQIFAGTNDYIGIDIDTKNQRADIFASIDKVPVENSVADVVCSFYVLEHVYNPKDVLKEKFRLLKDGGQLFMLVPLHWEEHEQPYDYWRFTQFALREMLNEVGFSGIEVKAINAYWAILGIHLVRILHSRKLTRAFVPIMNKLFYNRDQRSLGLGREASNVMTYAIKAVKSNNS
jgi:SAM-dependent methyltransferase